MCSKEGRAGWSIVGLWRRVGDRQSQTTVQTVDGRPCADVGEPTGLPRETPATSLLSRFRKSHPLGSSC